MKKYIIPAYWQMHGEYVIEAENKKEALEKVMKTPMPEGTYINNSLEIDLESVEEYEDI